MRWTISRSVIADIEAHARAERPRECCGLLIGVHGHVYEARRARNLADDPNRFLLDPQAHVEALRETRRRELEVVGFYHSHPHSAPVPSSRDLADGAYPELLHVIAGLGGTVSEIRAYHLLGDHFLEVEMETVVALYGGPQASSNSGPPFRN